MTGRERRSYLHIRRPPPLKARAGGATVEIGESPESDADRLIASFRPRAYSEARRRQRQAGSSEAAAHWSQVSNLIARRAGEPRGDESSTRIELDANVARGREGLAARPPSDFSRLTRWTSSTASSPPDRNASGCSSLASAPITVRPFSRKPKFKPQTLLSRSAKPPQQTGRRERSACACSIWRGGRSSSVSRPICGSVEARRVNDWRRMAAPATGSRGQPRPANRRRSAARLGFAVRSSRYA